MNLTEQSWLNLAANYVTPYRDLRIAVDAYKAYLQAQLDRIADVLSVSSDDEDVVERYQQSITVPIIQEDGSVKPMAFNVGELVTAAIPSGDYLDLEEELSELQGKYVGELVQVAHRIPADEVVASWSAQITDLQGQISFLDAYLAANPTDKFDPTKIVSTAQLKGFPTSSLNSVTGTLSSLNCTWTQALQGLVATMTVNASSVTYDDVNGYSFKASDYAYTSVLAEGLALIGESVSNLVSKIKISLFKVDSLATALSQAIGTTIEWLTSMMGGVFENFSTDKDAVLQAGDIPLIFVENIKLTDFWTFIHEWRSWFYDAYNDDNAVFDISGALRAQTYSSENDGSLYQLVMLPPNEQYWSASALGDMVISLYEAIREKGNLLIPALGCYVMISSSAVDSDLVNVSVFPSVHKRKIITAPQLLQSVDENGAVDYQVVAYDMVVQSDDVDAAFGSDEEAVEAMFRMADPSCVPDPDGPWTFRLDPAVLGFPFTPSGFSIPYQHTGYGAKPSQFVDSFTWRYTDDYLAGLKNRRGSDEFMFLGSMLYYILSYWDFASDATWKFSDLKMGYQGQVFRYVADQRPVDVQFSVIKREAAVLPFTQPQYYPDFQLSFIPYLEGEVPTFSVKLRTRTQAAQAGVAFMMSVLVAVVVATVAVRRVTRTKRLQKKLRKAQLKARQAQLAYEQNPTGKNLKAALKSSRKVRKCERTLNRITGVSSGMFDDGVSAATQDDVAAVYALLAGADYQ